MAPEQLLQAALAVFSRDGLQAATVRTIAREAGCDPALIYYHFRNKEAMFEALLEERIPKVAAELARLAGNGDGRPTSSRLWAVLGVLHRQFQDSPGFRSVLRGEVAQGAAGLRDRIFAQVVRVLRAVRGILEDGQRRGEVRPDANASLLAFYLLRMEFEILDLIPAAAGPIGGLDPETAVPLAERTWFEVFWRGVATDPLAPLPELASL